ncbi:MAG: hypothetical protein JRJ27_10835 [Deltaproteobacteria bacterium]|nr:hypothetical protein [Deltaproteobacteria bacterium]
MSALKLLEAESGPVLEDFPEEASVLEGEVGELASMRPWYDLALQKRGRTTVGVSKLELDNLGDFICAFLKGEIPENPRDDIALPYTLNLVTDDVKAYYFEAMTSQPGQESPSNEVLSDWFYDETVAGKVMFALRDLGKKSDDMLMKIIGNVLIIPAAQVSKRKAQAS